MSSREFERCDTMNGGRRLIVYRIECRRCGVISTIKGALPNEIVSKKFTERGWLVGHNEKNDFCPEHANAKRDRFSDPEKPVSDPEKPYVDRISTTMKGFEDALASYAELENPKSSEEVMAALEAFHARIFGATEQTT